MNKEKLVSEMTVGDLEELLSELIKNLPSYPYPVPSVPQPIWYGPQPNQPAYEIWCDTKSTAIDKEKK